MAVNTVSLEIMVDHENQRSAV